MTYPSVAAIDGEAPMCPLRARSELVNALAIRTGKRITTCHAATAFVARVARAAVSQVRVERVVRVVSADQRPVSGPL